MNGYRLLFFGTLWLAGWCFAGPEPRNLPSDALEITTPLTTHPGSAARGMATVLDRERGHCLLCHQISKLDAPSQGTIGPSLDGVARRLRPAQLRLRLVDSTRINPDTAMPAYHRVSGLNQVRERYQNKPVLDAQEIEDVLAFLLTLNGANHE